MAGRIGLDVALGSAGKTRDSSPGPRGPMRILVLGDLSGRGSRGLERADDLAARPIRRLDLDRFDGVLRSTAPAVHVRLAGAEDTTIAFESLDDFHPDRLYGRLEPFRAVRESRARLLEPRTFDQEAARLTADTGSSALLERLIGGPAPAAARPARQATIVDELVRRAMQSHVQTGSGASPAPYVAALDAATTQTLRAVLHYPPLQALESAWRGLRRFVENVELDGNDVELHVLDVSHAELLADATAHAGDARACGLYQCLTHVPALVEQARPWSLLVGYFAIDADAHDLALVAHLGSIAAQLGAPLLASAHPALVGAEEVSVLPDPARWFAARGAEVEKLWSGLRHSPIAPWIGLALPRVLLRQPYGRQSDRIDAFDFEELGASPRHEDYLWGSAALACAQSVAQAFLAHGPEFDLGGAFDIDDLPAVLHEHDGERVLLPCAEVQLPTEVGERLRERGFIPLLSYGNRNAVRVPGLRSISEPPRGLTGLD